MRLHRGQHEKSKVPRAKCSLEIFATRHRNVVARVAARDLPKLAAFQLPARNLDVIQVLHLEHILPFPEDRLAVFLVVKRIHRLAVLPFRAFLLQVDIAYEQKILVLLAQILARVASPDLPLALSTFHLADNPVRMNATPARAFDYVLRQIIPSPSGEVEVME